MRQDTTGHLTLSSQALPNFVSAITSSVLSFEGYFALVPSRGPDERPFARDCNFNRISKPTCGHPFRKRQRETKESKALT